MEYLHSAVQKKILLNQKRHWIPKFQVVGYSNSPTEKDWQWDKELLEHTPEEAPGENGHRSCNP